MSTLTNTNNNTFDGIDGSFFTELRTKISFIIIRHGETEANAESRIQGQSEYDLTQNGRMQATILASDLKSQNIVSILHSPLRRATETANIISKELAISDISPEHSLIELNTGHFTGKQIQEIEKNHPEEYLQFDSHSWASVKDAESPEKLYTRAKLAWKAMLNKALANEKAGKKGNILSVSHGGMIQWLFRVTFACKSWSPLISTGNCGVFELIVSPVIDKDGKALPSYIRWKEINKMSTVLPKSVPPVF